MQTQTWANVLLGLARTRRQHANIDISALTSALHAMVAEDLPDRCLETLAKAAVGPASPALWPERYTPELGFPASDPYA